MEYPAAAEVERCLNLLANAIGDKTDSPFRVDMVARYGGKPPVYTVIIRSANKEPIRRKLSEVLTRSFSMGPTSFALKMTEVQAILQYQQARS